MKNLLRILGFIISIWAITRIASAQEPPKAGGWIGEPEYVLRWLSDQKAPNGTSCCGLGDAVNVLVSGEDTEGLILKVTNPRSRSEIPVGKILHVSKERLVHVNEDPDGRAVAWVSVGGDFVYCLSSPPGI